MVTWPPGPFYWRPHHMARAGRAWPSNANSAQPFKVCVCARARMMLSTKAAASHAHASECPHHLTRSEARTRTKRTGCGSDGEAGIFLILCFSFKHVNVSFISEYFICWVKILHETESLNYFFYFVIFFKDYVFILVTSYIWLFSICSEFFTKLFDLCIKIGLLQLLKSLI